MPAYDYLCNACGRRFELRQKISDPAIESCPECGGAVRRLISGGAGVISRGSRSADSPASGAGCGLGAPCCAQDGACGNSDFCHR